MKRLLMILAAVVLTTASAWADRRAEGDALYEKFAHWGFDNMADSILAGRDAALAFFAENHQWEHYYYVANLAVQVHMLHEDNPSACLRECQQLYKFAADHRHLYGLASVQAQMGWIYGYLGDHQESVRLLSESLLPDGFTLKSNADAIRKILTRLMSNALKFTEQGSVVVKMKVLGQAKRQSREGNGLLEVAVEDTGIGIPPEHQEKIFERFYKVDTFKQGIGLGLTVARRTAELLDGTLTLDSTYTTGARFVLTLPAD